MCACVQLLRVSVHERILAAAEDFLLQLEKGSEEEEAASERPLRALLTERLAAAADEIIALLEETVAEYEDRAARSEQEICRQRRLLEAVLEPEVRLHRADDPTVQASASSSSTTSTLAPSSTTSTLTPSSTTSTLTPSSTTSTLAPSSTTSTLAPSSTTSTLTPSSTTSTLAPSSTTSTLTSSSTLAPSSTTSTLTSSSTTSTLTPSSTTSTLAPSSTTSTLTPSSTLAPSSTTSTLTSSSTLAPSSTTSTLAPSSTTSTLTSSSTLAPSSTTSTLTSSSTLAPSSTTSTLTSSSTLAPSSTTSTLAPSTSAMASGASILPCSSSCEAGVDAQDEDTAVDDINIPGYQLVDKLGEYLVALRNQTSLCLSNQQASQILTLWESLADGDEQRVVSAARHQERLLSSRFRTPRKPSKTPGVESTTRCMLGASSVPAQWPDCCRLVENICIRLCNIHQCPALKGKGADSRWSLILRDYNKIRQLVVGNYLVMQGTRLQLVVVNQNILIQWHNRQKRQELSVVRQGTSLPPALPVSEKEARVLPAAPVPARQEHQYQLPQSTAGQARQMQIAPRPIAPKLPVFLAPSAPGPLLTPPTLTPAGQTVRLVPVAIPMSVVQSTMPQTSATTTTADAGTSKKRPYKRTVEANTCKKCGQFRTADTGHSHYRGRVYCPQSETLTKAQWLEEMRDIIQIIM